MIKGASENQIQTQFFTWLSYAYKSHRLSCFAIPNGGKRDGREANNMKKAGVTPGVPDIFCAIPTHDYSGLFIELKSAKGKVSALQENMMTRLTQNGYLCVICYSIEEAMDAFKAYMEEGDARQSAI